MESREKFEKEICEECPYAINDCGELNYKCYSKWLESQLENEKSENSEEK